MTRELAYENTQQQREGDTLRASQKEKEKALTLVGQMGGVETQDIRFVPQIRDMHGLPIASS